MTDRTLLGKELTGDDVETELLRFMLERLHDTPLVREVQKDGEIVLINQTQRIFFAIQFIKDIAEERGLVLE